MATRRRGRALIFIAVFLILLLVLGFAAWRVLGPILNPPAPVPTEPPIVETPTPEVTMVEIVVTTQQIPRGGIITDDVIGLVPMPAESFVAGSFFQTREEVVGRRARYDLKPGTPVSEGLLLSALEGPSGFDIPRGMVAISIPISKLSSVSYGLKPGDHVNVITSMLMVDIDPNFQSKLPNLVTDVVLPGKLADQFTGTVTLGAGMLGRAEYDPTLGAPVYVYPSESQRPRLVSHTMIQDAVVLQVGLFAQGEPTVAQPAAAPDPNDPNAQPAQQTAPSAIPVPDVLTLIVNPQDAVSINFLMLSGAKLNLVMRSAGDDSIADLQSVTLQYILETYGIPNPAKLPYGIEPRSDTFQQLVPPFPEAGQPVLNLTAATPIPGAQQQQPSTPQATPAP